MPTALDKYWWWNTQGIKRTCQWQKDNAESLDAYVKNLVAHRHPYDAETAKHIDEAVTTLTAALLSSKLSQGAYERLNHPKLVAAE